MLADILAVAYTGSWSDFFNAEFTANFKIDFSHLSGHRFQTIDFVRNRDQVDMVRHEAISNEGDAVEDDVLAQQIEVDCSIGVALQDEATPIPTLRHMVWYVNGNHTSKSSHAKKRYQESFRRTAGSAR